MSLAPELIEVSLCNEGNYYWLHYLGKYCYVREHILLVLESEEILRTPDVGHLFVLVCYKYQHLSEEQGSEELGSLESARYMLEYPNLDSSIGRLRPRADDKNKNRWDFGR